MTATTSAQPSREFRVPSELSGGLPRAVRLSSRGLMLALVAAGLTAGAVASGILLSVAVARSNEERRLRERDGVPSEAEVVQITPRRGDTPGRLTYRYVVGGRDYTGRARLRNRDRRSPGEGTRVAIGYVRSRPETSWLQGDEPRGLPPWVVPLTSLSLVAGAAAVARTLGRQRRLLADGRVAEARITKQTKVRKGRYQVTYQFRALSGATLTLRLHVERAPPPVGAKVPVVYHRDRPEWSALYPLSLVRPERTRHGQL